MKKPLLLCLLFSLTACSESVLETSDASALRQSTERMADALDKDSAARFREDIAILNGAGSDIRNHQGKNVEQIRAAAIAELERHASLERFTLLSAKVNQRQNAYSHFRSTRLELVVRNDTAYEIGEAFFEARLISPDRALPWLTESFSYRSRPAIQPGEEAIWRITPMVERRWDIDFPAEAELTVIAYRLDDPQGRTLYSIEDSLDDGPE
ncbi:hypothetical protein CK507_16580 [Pseudomonas sp. WN033]|nr:hypothetical protein CK507_16580 [Pseudomonas sp. WN033]